jgi:hypothetical protein
MAGGAVGSAGVPRNRFVGLPQEPEPPPVPISRRASPAQVLVIQSRFDRKGM